MLLEQIKHTNTYRITTTKRHSSFDSAVNAFLSEIPEAKRAFYMGEIAETTKKPLLKVNLTPKKPKGKLKPAKKGRAKSDKSNTTTA